MALHDLQDAHRMLERRIGLWQASNPIRTHVACVFPGARLQAIRAGSWIETREQPTVVLVAVLISDERCCISVVDDVLLEVAFVLQNVADDAAEKRDVRPCADLHEHIGDGRGARVSRIDMDQHGPAVLSHHRPVKADRVRLRHIRAHDENTIAVSQVARMVRSGTETK